MDDVVVELDSARAAIAVTERLQSLGYTGLEAYTPFPVPELERALVRRKTKLGWLVLAAGALGAVLSLALLVWTSAIDYPLDVGGRPLDSIPAHVPIVFESAVLAAAVTAFVAALVLSGLPRLHHRVFDMEGFTRTTIDRFWIVVPRSTHTRDDIAQLRDALLPLGACDVREAEERSS